MKKEYKAPSVDFVEFDDVVTADGSSVHDGTETSCTCTSFYDHDLTKV